MEVAQVAHDKLTDNITVIFCQLELQTEFQTVFGGGVLLCFIDPRVRKMGAWQAEGL